MKTILAGNANACLKNQINNMERKIHSTVNVLYPCNPAYSKLASVRLPKRISFVYFCTFAFVLLYICICKCIFEKPNEY